MSGRILIVDGVATNRIVMQARLAPAHYEVIQAASGHDALRLAAETGPDLVLAGATLPDMNSAALVSALRGCDSVKSIPIVVLTCTDDHTARRKALAAGADEILCHSLEDTLLRARLRSLLRQNHNGEELQHHAGTIRALGFAEPQHQWPAPTRIALVGRDETVACQWLSEPLRTGPHRIRAMGAQHAVTPPADQPAPDIFLLAVDGADPQPDLRLMADLGAAPRSRNSPVIALLPAGATGLAATALDMGASDVAFADSDPQDLQFRVTRQIERKRAADRMRQQLKTGLEAAAVDPLTGLYNRRYARAYMTRLLEKDRDGPGDFAVMVADLDHFKRVNDTHGHATGDAVLTEVARLLRAALPPEGLVARIGGEEFLIAIPGTTRSKARRIAGDLCRVIGSTPITTPGPSTQIGITISIGITLGRAGAAPGQTVEGLLAQADRALYDAKACGRNTITLSGARSAA